MEKLLIAIIFLILLFTPSVHAGIGDTGPGDLAKLFRDVVDYIRAFFANPESGFSESAINYNIAYSGLPQVRIGHRSFFSRSLGKEKNYTILLPPGYNDSQKRYPVYYLLHGAWGDERTWTARGDIVRIYQEMIADGTGKMIIAMPDGDNSVWENTCWIMACGNYEDYFIEFVREIDSRYRTTGRRGIGGLSFGARGAVRLAFLRPDMLDFAGGHSGYYYYLIQEMDNEKWDRLKSSGLVIYFDNSRNDPLTDYSESSRNLSRTLEGRGIPHEYMELDFFTAQSHAWTYWRQQVKVAMQKACQVIC